MPRRWWLVEEKEVEFRHNQSERISGKGVTGLCYLGEMHKEEVI
jgi:hypothetical protein